MRCFQAVFWQRMGSPFMSRARQSALNYKSRDGHGKSDGHKDHKPDNHPCLKCQPKPKPCPCPPKPKDMQCCEGIPITAEDIGTTGLIINDPGHYVLAENAVFSPAAFAGPCLAAITVNADDVCIDGCCHTLSQFRQGMVATPDVIGIRVIASRKNFKIDNISITDFSAAVMFIEYGVDGVVLGDNMEFRDSGYLGTVCYPQLDGFNPDQQGWSAGGVIFGGILRGDDWFTDPLAPVAPFNIDQPVKNVYIGKFKSTGHTSIQGPITKTSPFRPAVSKTLPKVISGVGGSVVEDFVVEGQSSANISELATVNFGTQTGGGTARGFTFAVGRRGVLRGVVAQDVSCTLGLTGINITPGQDILFDHCTAQRITLLEDVLLPSRGVVGIGAGGPLPNTANSIPSFNITVLGGVSQDIGIGPNVTGVRNLGAFIGGGFAAGLNFRGATNVVFKDCHSMNVLGAGNMLTSGYFVTSDAIGSDSSYSNIRTRGAADLPSFQVNGCGVLVSPPPRNSGVPVNIDQTFVGVGKSTFSNIEGRDGTFGFRIIDNNNVAGFPGNPTSVMIRNSSYIPIQAGDKSLVATGESLNGIFQFNNAFIN